MDKILIIDDKHAILESLEMFFAEKGYRVYTADCGATGMALYNRHEPDVASSVHRRTASRNSSDRVGG